MALFVDRCAALAATCILLAASAPLRAQAISAVDTSGSFRIYKLQHDVGRETYRVLSSGEGRTIESAWAFRYIGSDVHLNATLKLDASGRPSHFVEKGQTSTLTTVDLEVALTDSARIHDHGLASTSAVVGEPFPLSSYPPAIIEQELFRRWQALGRPREIPLLPSGSASFEFRGRSTVAMGGKRVALRRYVVQGVLWGRQAMWATSDDRNIVAVVNGDAELDRFEAVREEYAAALKQFVQESVADGINSISAAERNIVPLAAGAYALTDVTIIDGTGALPMQNAVIVVNDGKVIAVGPASTTPVPPRLRRVNLAGKTIVPGLWDMHVHFEQVEWPAAQLAAGVTTARDVGNEQELATDLRNAIRERRILGPHMLLAGLIDGAPDGLGVHLAATKVEARARVKEYHDAGYEQIKIYSSLPPSLVSIIAQEAHRLGMTVTGHVPSGMNATEFVAAGADQINHYGYMLAVMQEPVPQGQPRPPIDTTSDRFRTAIAFFKAHRTVLDPTLARYEQNAHPRDSLFSVYEPGAAKAPPALAEVLNASGASSERSRLAMTRLAASLPIIGQLRAAGIPIVAGTDLVVPGYSIYRELELEVRAGFTPMQAIQAATLIPARVMKLDDVSGSIAAGKRADLLILDANPLDDISNIRRVSAVIVDGRMFDPSALWRISGFTP